MRSYLECVPCFVRQALGAVRLLETEEAVAERVLRRVTAFAAPIGLSIVSLICREGNVLRLKGLDILDGTPLLDIKPYIARFDRIENTRHGWQDEVTEKTAKKRGKRRYRRGQGLGPGGNT